MIEWFNSLQDKHMLKFIIFDIEEFYPSISEDLLKDSLAWAKQFTNIQDFEYDAIFHATRTLLYDNEEKAWVKKDVPKEFDVSMGALDGAEVCELVGLFILNNLNDKLDVASLGLYRDDGLAVLKSQSGSAADRVRKQLIKTFNTLGLKITVQTNLTSAAFLDVTLNLQTGKHQPYRKPNDEPLYIHVNSNHPPVILKQIPTSVEKRISSLSADEDTFKKAAPMYNRALNKSGFRTNISFRPETNNKIGENTETKKRKRRRKTTWFNPPFSKTVKTNVGKKFLRLIDRHFPRNSKLNKYLTETQLKSATHV